MAPREGTTGTNGSVTFNTVFPGWYGGRTIHFHLRIRFSASTTFAVTSQLFVSDAFLTSYKTLAPYSSNTGAITTLAQDNIYTGISSAIASRLVLNPVGSVAAGYTASVNVGIASSSTSSSTATATPTTPPTPTSSSSTIAGPVSPSMSAAAPFAAAIVAVGGAVLGAVLGML